MPIYDDKKIVFMALQMTSLISFLSNFHLKELCKSIHYIDVNRSFEDVV